VTPASAPLERVAFAPDAAAGGADAALARDGAHAHALRVARGRTSRLALRDALATTVLLIAAVAAGSRGFRDVDRALLGYLVATVACAFATTWRASAFWRRPASAFYARALLASLREPRRLRRTVAAAGRDLAAQDFLRRRSTARWVAHVLLSGGTLASFAITLPLVFGWLRFAPAGDRSYRVALFGLPTARFDVDGPIGWLLFHALALAGAAVLAGASAFLFARLRARRAPETVAASAIAPLVLLIVVAASGLALPATRGLPALFPSAAALHEAAVVALLVAIPFSKLGHVLVRPLQLGARAVRSEDGASWPSCGGCGAALAPVAQRRVVEGILVAHGLPVARRSLRCPACRRREVAAAQARLVGAHFQPRISGARPGGSGPASALSRRDG